MATGQTDRPERSTGRSVHTESDARVDTRPAGRSRVTTLVWLGIAGRLALLSGVTTWSIGLIRGDVNWKAGASNRLAAKGGEVGNSRHRGVSWGTGAAPIIVLSSAPLSAQPPFI